MIRRLTRRHYSPYRRAYYPRVWPMMVVAGLVPGAVSWVLAPGLLWSFTIAACFGFTVSFLRLRIWRWRHPMITWREREDDLRRAARWN